MSAVKRAIARRRRPRRADKRGVALVMTLGAITVLTVFLTELQDQTASELSAALSERDALRAEYYARSAVNLSRLLIAIEPEIRKAIPMLGSAIPQIPVWEFTDLVLGSFNDPAGAESFNNIINADAATGKNLGLTGGGHYELKIVDEDSKININTAARGLPSARDRQGIQLLGLFSPQSFNPMFEGRDADNQFSDRQTICGAIVDWADDDEELYGCDPRGASASGSKGAEDNFYQTIGLGYRRKNAAFDSLDELRLVRGVSDDFWSTFVDPDPTDPHKRVLTVWGRDVVNINTANAQTLLTIVCGEAPDAEVCNDPVQMMGFLQAVSLVRSFTMGAPIFQKKGDFVKLMQGTGPMSAILTTLGVTPVKFKSPSQVTAQVDIKSKMFSIYAEGVVPGFKRTTRVKIHAVVDFRSAGEIGEGLGLLQGGGGTNNQSAAQATPEQLAQIAGANPAGSIVYWRVE
jgi:general secretion pathway protein K